MDSVDVCLGFEMHSCIHVLIPITVLYSTALFRQDLLE